MQMNKDIRRKRHNLGYAIAVFSTISLIIILTLSESKSLLMPGPINIGHSSLDCEECHQNAVGNFRQQLQANAQYLLNNRSLSANVGYRPVENQDCLECHSRENDRHSVYRFYEPRFKEARDAISPHQCVSCHQEHTGVRVTSGTGFCSSCHNELKLKKDPLEIPHTELIKEKKWKSCLGCHDYHGNHIMESIKESIKAHSQYSIIEYFNGGKSPYSKDKKYKAKEARKND